MENLKIYISSITDMSEESWNILSDCFKVLDFKKNELLLKEGNVCNSIFFISSGLCKAYFNLDGKEVNTAFYLENDFATNINSLINTTKSEYNIIACEKTIAIQFDKVKLLKAYSQSHQIETFGRKILEIISTKQEEHANNFKLLTPKQRYDSLILKQPHLFQRVSLTQISSYLGISRETLSRFRSQI